LATVRLFCLTVAMILSINANDYWYILYGIIITNLAITSASICYIYKHTQLNLIKSLLNSLVQVFLFTLGAYLLNSTLESQLFSSFLYWILVINLLIIVGKKMKIPFILDILDITSNLVISFFQRIIGIKNK